MLADESLDVTYELRMYAWTAETTGIIVLKGVTHDVVQKSAQASLWSLSGNGLNAGLNLNARAFTGPVSPDINGGPTGTSIGSATITAVAYTPGSLTRTLNIAAGLSQWNNAIGIGSFQLESGWGRWQIGFTPNILKTAEENLNLQVRHSWGRKA